MIITTEGALSKALPGDFQFLPIQSHLQTLVRHQSQTEFFVLPDFANDSEIFFFDMSETGVHS